jgi:hypothetical protein
MRIADCGSRIRRFLWRCLVVAAVAVCMEAFLSRLDNPQSAIRNPHFHKVHVSVTNLEFDRPKQVVEIVIRVFTDDLENALSMRAKQSVKIDPATAGKDGQFIEPAMAYLRSNFELKNKAGRPVILSWSGIEGPPDGQANMIWIFVKGRMPGGLEGAQMRNKIFCELFDDQVNIINAKHRGKQIGLMFESKDDFKILR